jgi:hypothetical protein
LSAFSREVQQLKAVSINIGDKVFGFLIDSFICDAPARSLVKNTKLHSGYNSCDRCIQKGEWHNKVVFPRTDSVLRTDTAFDEMVDSEHHHGSSALSGLGIGFVSQFCLDYIHMICLGVCRRLMHFWRHGPPSAYKLSAGMMSQISQHLEELRSFIPSEFARKPRSLADCDRWKATEFREFLLYTGPVVLKGIMNDSVYHHFMLLSVAVYICVNPCLCHLYAENARELIDIFVQHAPAIYGVDMLVYNVHSLIHIVDAVIGFGPLDGISAFPFESHLHTLKKMVRCSSKPFQQILNRLAEKQRFGTNNTIITNSCMRKPHCNGPIPA